MALEINYIELDEMFAGQVVEVHITGKLEKADYEYFVPEIERLIGKHGKINILFFLTEFEGWSAGALWEEIKFDLKHLKDLKKIAMVGDRRWEEEALALLCRPFTSAEVKFFPVEEVNIARQWLIPGQMVQHSSGD